MFLRRLQMPIFVSRFSPIKIQWVGAYLDFCNMRVSGVWRTDHPRSPGVRATHSSYAPCLLYYAGLCYRVMLMSSLSSRKFLCSDPSLIAQVFTWKLTRSGCPQCQCCKTKEIEQIEKYDDSFNSYVCSSVLESSPQIFALLVIVLINECWMSPSDKHSQPQVPQNNKQKRWDHHWLLTGAWDRSGKCH